MSKTQEKNRIFKFFAFIFCFAIFVSQAEAKNISIRFEGRKMSANIDGVHLGEVFEKIKAQREFCVKGDESILNNKVSVSFENLSFQDGLKKILGETNHILLFDKNKAPIGVILAGDGGSQVTVKTSPDEKKVEAASNNKKHVKPEDTSDKLYGATPASDMTPPTEEELANMKVIRDAPTPGGPVEVSEQEMENFKIMKSDTPPGGNVKVTPEELESMKPASDSGPMPKPGTKESGPLP